MIEIFSASRQLWKVRLWMWISVALALPALWWGWDLFQTYGLRPADGGALAPLPVRLVWGGTVAGLGLALVYGMWLYGGLYVTTMAYDEASDRLHVRTLSFLGDRDRVFAAADIEGSTYQGGDFWAGGVAVNAPWITVRMRGRRLPFIVDAQGELPSRDVGRRLFGGRS